MQAAPSRSLETSARLRRVWSDWATRKTIEGSWAITGASWIFFAVVALAPLPFGSFDPTAVSFWCALLGVALVLAPVRQLRAQHFALIGLGAIVVAAYGFVLHEQLSAHPWLSIATPDPIWRQAGALLGERLEPSVAIVRNEPYFAIGAPLVAILSLAMGFVLGADDGVALKLLRVVAWSGACYAIYGIVQYVVDPTMILWREKQAYVAVLTSTFVNRNTAAVYFGSCSVIWLLFASKPIRSWMIRDQIAWRGVFERFIAKIPRDVAVSVLMLLTCLTAMFMTGSRAGVILSLIALALAFNLYFRRVMSSWIGLLIGAAVSGGIAVLILQLMGEGVIERFDVRGAADEGRLATYRATLRMIADHPWLGTGQGTFAWAFPAYRSSEASMMGVWDIAHNTLLEIASDMGIPIAILVAFSWAVIFAILILGTRAGPEHNLVIRTSALSIAFLAVSHSMIDFSLQIPGYSTVALALVGAGLSQCCVPKPQGSLKISQRVQSSR